jgi:hypothetical protein
MSDVNLDFTVSNNSIDFTVESNDITFTPSDIQLTVFPGGAAAGGSNGMLQYNYNGFFGGIPSANYNGTNLTFQIANTKITGGDNHYYLQTDGTGNLTWAVGTGNMQGNGTVAGANTQIQFNDGGANFGGNAGFTFNKITGDVNIPGSIWVVGNINGNIVPNFANYAGNVTVSSQPNITSLGTLTTLLVNGNANITGNVNVTGNTNISNLANVGNLRVNSTDIALGSASLAGFVGVSIGNNAGNVSPGAFTVAIGNIAGGLNSGNHSVAIGDEAGRENIGLNSISIGHRAGYYFQGANSIAIGSYAGAQTQPSSSIIINATGSNLDATTANALYVKPVRQGNTGNALFYNATTGEITFDASTTSNANYAAYAGNVVNSSQPNITSVGTLTGLNVNGNITAKQFISNIATGNAPFVVTSTTQVANLNVQYAGTANSVAGANVSGEVANATYASSAGTITWNNYIPIGVSANASNTFGIAIGSNTRSLGNGISIGRNAGRDPNAFAPGNNVIIINATGANLPYQGTDGTCFIAPMGSSSYFGNGTQELMYYNTSTKEVRSSTNGLAGYNGNITANNISASNNITSNNYIKSKVFVSANIASPIGAGAGARSFVSDATSTTFGALYASGGANNVPVYSDGSAWRIG